VAARRRAGAGGLPVGEHSASTRQADTGALRLGAPRHVGALHESSAGLLRFRSPQNRKRPWPAQGLHRRCPPHLVLSIFAAGRPKQERAALALLGSGHQMSDGWFGSSWVVPDLWGVDSTACY